MGGGKRLNAGRGTRHSRARAARQAATGAGSTTGGMHLSLSSPRARPRTLFRVHLTCSVELRLALPSPPTLQNRPSAHASRRSTAPHPRTTALRGGAQGATRIRSAGVTPPVCVSGGNSSSRSRRRTVLLHGLEELHHHLRARAHEHLALSALLRVVDGLERIRECSHASHDELREAGGGGEGGQYAGMVGRGLLGDASTPARGPRLRADLSRLREWGRAQQAVRVARAADFRDRARRVRRGGSGRVHAARRG